MIALYDSHFERSIAAIRDVEARWYATFHHIGVLEGRAAFEARLDVFEAKIADREERLLAWLERVAPDVVCLQELKCTDDQFPYDAIDAAGYQAAVHGQKTYNGVAILAKSSIDDVAVGFDDGGDDSQARLISGTVGGVRVVSAYVVNGKPIDSDKYAFKLEWLDRLERFVAGQDLTAPLALCGDYNIAPDERDVEKKEAWEGGVLYNEDLTARFRSLIDLGLVDTFRAHHEEAGLQQRLAFADIDDFYYLSRTIMVKDEKYFDRFDKAFGVYFKDLEALDDIIEALIPDDGLRKEFEPQNIDRRMSNDEVFEQGSSVSCGFAALGHYSRAA